MLNRVFCAYCTLLNRSLLCYNIGVNRYLLCRDVDILTISKAKRDANNKWDAANMAVLGCKVKKEQAERFKQHAAQQGTTANNLLKGFVLSYIGENDTGETGNNPTQ